MAHSAIVQPAAVKQVRKALQDLPEKYQEHFSLRATVEQICLPLQAAIAKGYSYQELASVLQQQGIQISASTLKNYISSGKRQAAKRNASNLARSRRTASPRAIPNAVEVVTQTSTYTISHDFWEAYQASLTERAEVYHRLAQS